MIDKKHIEKLVNEFISGTGIFIVSVKVNSGNRITILADTKKDITIDECVSLHRFLENNLDREAEDYEMQVSSPGLDMPFLVIEQYYKNEGKKIEVTDNGGEKFCGILKNVNSGGFELETEVKVKGKGKESREISFNFDDIKSAKAVLTIK